MITRAAVVVSILLVAACGGGAPGDSPESAVEAYLVALDAGDCAGVKAVARVPDDVECDVIEGSDLGGLDPETATYSVTDKTGPSATVVVDWTGDTPDDEIYVQEMDDGWKVVLDSAV